MNRAFTYYSGACAAGGGGIYRCLAHDGNRTRISTAGYGDRFIFRGNLLAVAAIR